MTAPTPRPLDLGDIPAIVRPGTAPVVSDLRVVRSKSGWAVACGGTGYVYECRTKREAQQWVDDALRRRAEIADQERQRATTVEQVDYRELHEGDRYATRIDCPFREVTEIKPCGNGAALIWSTDPAPHLGFLLHTPGMPTVYRLRPKAGDQQ